MDFLLRPVFIFFFFLFFLPQRIRGRPRFEVCGGKEEGSVTNEKSLDRKGAAVTSGRRVVDRPSFPLCAPLPLPPPPPCLRDIRPVRTRKVQEGNGMWRTRSKHITYRRTYTRTTARENEKQRKDRSQESKPRKLGESVTYKRDNAN